MFVQPSQGIAASHYHHIAQPTADLIVVVVGEGQIAEGTQTNQSHLSLIFLGALSDKFVRLEFLNETAIDLISELLQVVGLAVAEPILAEVEVFEIFAAHTVVVALVDGVADPTDCLGDEDIGNDVVDGGIAVAAGDSEKFLVILLAEVEESDKSLAVIASDIGVDDHIVEISSLEGVLHISEIHSRINKQ